MVQECRMYENCFPEVDDVVMVQVKSIAEMGAYVQLLEYDNVEGMILLSELTRRRIRSVSKLIKVGRIEPVMVLRVDKEKGYIDLSKRRVSPEDIQACENKYNKSKMVHSILRHVAETTSSHKLDELYEILGWPLYKAYGHAYDAFQLMVTDPDAVFNHIEEQPGSVLQDHVKAALVKDIRRRMTPQPLKIRADVELTCFNYDGVEVIRSAMRAAEAVSTETCEIKASLVASPLYVFTTQTADKKRGIEALASAIDAAAVSSSDIEQLLKLLTSKQATISHANGTLNVKEHPRTVSERDDRVLAEKLENTNPDRANETDSEDDTMGSVDI